MKSKKITKAYLYKDIVQQGFLLPKSTSTICNLAYLFSVRNGIEYCPMENEVSNLDCPNPPKRMLLLHYIQVELEKNEDMRTLSFDEKHLPDVDWCLKALSALDPLHKIFDPEYEPSFSQRGRRGQRYIPSAEELFSLDQSIKHSQSDKYSSEKEDTVPQFKDKSKVKQSNVNLSRQKENQSKIKVQNTFKEKGKIDRKNNTEDEEKKNDMKQQFENKKIGPLVKMLKTLDQKGLLQECMQHYIDIQSSYDNQNDDKKGRNVAAGQLCNRDATDKQVEPDLVDVSQKFMASSTSFPSGNALFQAKLCSEFWKEGPVSFQSAYYTQEKQFKEQQIQYNWNKKYNKFTKSQNPLSITYQEENGLHKSKSNSKHLSNAKTSASSELKNHLLSPKKTFKKARAFGTPESLKNKADQEMISEVHQFTDKQNFEDNKKAYQHSAIKMQLQCSKDQENAVERNDNNQNNNQPAKNMTETIFVI